MSSSYRPPKTIPLVKFTDVEDVDGFFSENLKNFNEHLNNYNSHVEKVLHNIKNDSSEKEKYKKKITCYDYLSSTLKVPKDIALNVLVVENEPLSISQGIETLKYHFKGLKVYLIKDKFAELAKGIRNGNKEIKKDHINVGEGEPFEKNLPNNFEFKSIDLILQDIFLGSGNLSGLEIANLYFDIAPQAMVFFLTSIDIETLAASGYDKKVDRLVGKDRILGLMKYYYDRFSELYGSVLWPVFAKANERNGKAELTDRTSLRRLLGNIRSWTVEPKILFHGFALPEMVDHEFRHTAGLWKMANRILGPFFERMPDAMEPKEKVLLSLAIWLHDIGHRGDEHHYEPMEIREHHGSISESLILKHYGAFGIEWLKDFCQKDECKQYKCCYGTLFRNKRKGCFEEEICPLRNLGLLCRYHQSNAPLTKEKLPELILKLKMPSPYCMVGMDGFKQETKLMDYQKQIDDWLDKTKDFGCVGTDIRTLDEFDNNKQLLNLTGMLRWLDALHTHSDKVGSSLEVKSFFSYLDMRKQFSENRIKEIENLLDKTVVGSEAYLKYLDERRRIDGYSQLLDVQDIHLWRSGLVRDISGEWFWDEDNGKWAYRIIFELFEKEQFKLNKDIEDGLEGEDVHNKWIKHVWKEVIESEIKNQLDEGNLTVHFNNYFKDIDIYYYCKFKGTAMNMCDGRKK